MRKCLGKNVLTMKVYIKVLEWLVSMFRTHIQRRRSSSLPAELESIWMTGPSNRFENTSHWEGSIATCHNTDK